MTLAPGDALVEAGVIAAQFLELDAADLAVVERCVPTAVLALALLFVETDPVFSPRWRAAGSNWVDKAEVLRDALIYVLTPEQAPRADA